MAPFSLGSDVIFLTFCTCSARSIFVFRWTRGGTTGTKHFTIQHYWKGVAPPRAQMLCFYLRIICESNFWKGSRPSAASSDLEGVAVCVCVCVCVCVYVCVGVEPPDATGAKSFKDAVSEVF